MTLIAQLVTLTRVGVLHHASWQSLMTLQTRNCGNLWEDLHQEMKPFKLHAPLAILNQLPGVNSQGAVILMGMTRRSPFQEGEGGFLPSPTPVPAWPDGGWVPLGPPPQPLRPPPANLDVGCLINTLASGLCLGTPRINTFNGEAMPGRTEVSFEKWYHEVQCVKDHYPESVVQECIVQSFKGAVADMAWYMDPTASVREILQKLTVIFGTVASFDVLMQKSL